MRRILCVIDLTNSSLNVLKVAASTAQANKAQLTILFPYRLINYDYKGDMAKLKEKLEQEAKEKFLEIKTEVATMDQVSFEFLPEIGFAMDRINSYDRKNNLDMIIIGQDQANKMDEINGGVFQNLITNSKLPFIIVPSVA